MQPIIISVQKDSAPDVTFPITRKDGSPVDLSGCTVLFKIQDPVTKQRTNDPAGSITNVCAIVNAVGTPTNPATVVYSWNTGGTDIPDVGTYRAILQIIHANGKPESKPVRIDVGATV